MVIKTRVLLSGVFLGTLGVLPVIAQVRPVIDTSMTAPAANTSLPDHPIVPNDLLSVMVFDEPGLSKTARVSADGTFQMPVLKDPIKVTGLLPRDVETKVSEELLDQQILVHPVTAVSIVEYASKMVSVVGDVHIPGQFTVTAPISLYDALAKAGWTTTDAGADVLLTKTPTDPPIRINLLQLQLGKDLSLNPMLTGGEVVNVPDAPKVWVTGNVTKPQAVSIRTPSDASVLKVVASAEGLAQYYNKTAYIYRANASGNRTEIVVPIFAIMHRKAQDIALMPDDILLIPDDNGTKRREFLAILTGMAGAGASGAVLVGIEKK
jgi:polysaccharide export outer membrane protein